MKNKVLVIISGGLDSTVLAYYIKKGNHRDLVGGVSINYGQRHKYELNCARSTCKALGVPHTLLDLSSLREALSASSLTSDAPVPEGHYAAENMKATVVPNRNMILMALAVGVAITNGADMIAYGAHAGDHAIYPDCRPEFADAMAAAISLCDYKPPQLIRPFIHKTKADIVRLGIELGVPFEHTWTCYNGVPEGTTPQACGRCGTCVERLEAFAEAGVEDPLLYTDREFWKTVVSIPSL